MSNGKGSRAYSAAAKQQAVNAGMAPRAASRLVNRNANTRTRTSSRANYVNRLGL